MLHTLLKSSLASTKFTGHCTWMKDRLLKTGVTGGGSSQGVTGGGSSQGVTGGESSQGVTGGGSSQGVTNHIWLGLAK